MVRCWPGLASEPRSLESAVLETERADVWPLRLQRWRVSAMDDTEDFLHEISSRLAAADSLHLVLDRIVGSLRVDPM